jgi:hypothetical protein
VDCLAVLPLPTDHWGSKGTSAQLDERFHETDHNAWAGLHMIREAIETLGPPAGAAEHQGGARETRAAASGIGEVEPNP